MKRLMAPLLCAGVITAGTAMACDDHHGECAIEDWRWLAVNGMNSILVNGVATCNEGKLALRIYEGEGGKFLGSETTYIDQHIFQGLFMGVESPSDFAIKYSIEPM